MLVFGCWVYRTRVFYRNYLHVCVHTLCIWVCVSCAEHALYHWGKPSVPPTDVMYVCAPVWAAAHVHTCLHTWKTKVNIGHLCFGLHLSTLCFEKGSLSKTGAHQLARWLAGELLLLLCWWWRSWCVCWMGCMCVCLCAWVAVRGRH